MMALLSPRFWLGLALVAALTFTHVFVYRSGRAAVRVEWDKERAVQMADALKADEANRVKEKALNASNLKVANDYIAHKQASAAAAAVSADKLRELAAALDSAARTSAATSGSPDGAAFAIARECSANFAEMGGYAENLASQVTGLQDYVKLVTMGE